MSELFKRVSASYKEVVVVRVAKTEALDALCVASKDVWRMLDKAECSDADVDALYARAPAHAKKFVALAKQHDALQEAYDALLGELYHEESKKTMALIYALDADAPVPESMLCGLQFYHVLSADYRSVVHSATVDSTYRIVTAKGRRALVETNTGIDGDATEELLLVYKDDVEVFKEQFPEFFDDDGDEYEAVGEDGEDGGDDDGDDGTDTSDDE